ncbi:alpha/beta fold hydrolase [Catellatospora coxensis]|uniref:Carboxylesterase n=1 Tax=Catellatospora coxensis TaxID=310354 RepID=A0A8J3KTG8_9ACTN|nr:alpha/beta hydrolase [Catellatospora coxensis]GIG06815.1 carboxylesterase [Catellatospora coxensis]
MTEARLSAFTGDKARSRFLAAYGRTFDKVWPADHRRLDVPTSFGVTRVYRTGPADGVPFVLLPGAGGNALGWHRHVARWGAERPVIAIDPVGEPGCSTQDRPLADGRDLARWLDEVLAGLDVDRVHVVGCSYGGWIALQHQLHTPGRAASITLLDPAGFGLITKRFLLWVILGGLAGLTPRPLRHRAARRLRNATLLDDDLMGLALASTGFRRRLPAPPPLTDDELRQITVPTLALLGGRSQMYDAAQVAARIRALMPAARADVVAEAGHDLQVHSPELVIERAAEFAAGAEAATGAAGQGHPEPA